MHARSRACRPWSRRSAHSRGWLLCSAVPLRGGRLLVCVAPSWVVLLSSLACSRRLGRLALGLCLRFGRLGGLAVGGGRLASLRLIGLLGKLAASALTLGWPLGRALGDQLDRLLHGEVCRLLAARQRGVDVAVLHIGTV